jgi:hypothetical protein
MTAVLGRQTEFGRLIRVKCDLKLLAYIVALADPAAAIALIRKKVAGPADEVQDVAPVSDDLLRYLDLQSGEFMRADATHPFERRPSIPVK